jgi:cytochrome c-type biogenesis protein CcmF
MLHTLIGDLGHLFVILSFVLSIVATFAYFKSTTSNEIIQKEWLPLARTAFFLHFAAVTGVVVVLFLIIYNHYFEYHYAWSHSARSLPVYYMISCFWEGQEGSFLLWTFWNALLGLILIKTNKNWEAPVMAVFAAVQCFLASMILGVDIFGVKLGSSPFILLRDALEAPIFAINPEFVPEDGTGLNPLLQNYWMVIHPPTLFLGFAATLIPFAYCIAGLWTGKYKEWIRPALPWSLFSALILGAGIIMGAYWAYETLNFGGYWNWDPVENAVYVPWLILIAAIHTMIAFKKSNTALKTSIILVITTFILILYSTFLTRSGILGDASVHSFTDLGLSGQLLIYLLFFTVISLILAAARWKNIPTTDQEVSTYSREFWIFIGTTTLCLMGFQVLVPTSIPVYNAIIEALGGISNVAPPAEPEIFYSKFQLWFGAALALLSGTGQFFWWNKMDKAKLKNALITPILITLLVSSLAIVLSGVKNPAYIFLLVCGIYSIVANSTVFISLTKGNFKLAGGSVAHIGVAMILIGIMFSAGYSKVISLNNTGLLYSRDFPDEINRENLLLFVDDPRQMQEYNLIYRGQRIEAKGVSEYIPSYLLKKTEKPEIAIAKKDIFIEGKKLFSAGDTIEIHPENTYFEVAYINDKGKEFVLFPRAQVNPSMGVVYSPDIKRRMEKDLYTHVSTYPIPDQELDWSETEEFTVKIGEQFFVNDYVAVLEGLERVFQVDGVQLEKEDVAVQANVKVMGKTVEYALNPVYLIKGRIAGLIPETLNDLGVKISLKHIDPEKGEFTFAVNTTQKDYIILKAIEKPFINILWIGTIMLMIGFGLAIRRRYSEFKSMRDKNVEPAPLSENKSKLNKEEEEVLTNK